MKVVFRVDASHAIASGHITRCLALAQSLRKRGAACTFISREVDGHLFASVVGAGFEQLVLAGPLELTPQKLMHDGAQVTVKDDAQGTIAALAGERPTWLVIDHYGIDDEWEHLLRPHVDRILVIDDLANRHHECEVLVDQNFSLIGPERYSGLVREGTLLLCGPKFALLQPEFARQRLSLHRGRSTGLQAFISFGGSDRENLTSLALDAFQLPALKGITLEVAIGQHNPNRDALEKRIAERPDSRAHYAPKSLAPLMAQSDFAIGAGGTTTWERFCLDLPSVVIALAKNQVQTCESLAASGRINYVGFWTDVTVATLRLSIQQICRAVEAPGLTSPEPLVDGLGAERVAEIMAPSPIDALVLRPATSQDVAAYFSWVNDPDVRSQSLKTEQVSWSEHQLWFDHHLATIDSLMFVLEARDLPLGQVRFDCTADGALLDYSVDTIVRGRGLGATLVRRGLQQLERRRPLTVSAEVRDGNRASAITLTRLGFEVNESTAGGGPLRISIISDRRSWINDSVAGLVLEWVEDGHRVSWGHLIEQVPPGELCFYLSCGQLAPPDVLERFQHNLVVHESDLPLGRGWSPLSWQIIEGASDIAVTLFEAESSVDSGCIYAQVWLHFDGTELVTELRAAQAVATISLCRNLVEEYPQSVLRGRPQVGSGTNFRRRAPADSALDPNLTLGDQFDLLRTVDNDRYPATLEIRGGKYRLSIERITE